MSATVRETTLRELVMSGTVSGACATGQQGGYSIAVQCGSGVRTLATSRGDVRLFTLERASAFLSGLGIMRFEVDATHYQPGRLRKPRPDRAEALRKTRTRPTQEPLL
ncbi:hypothetical protein SCB29_22340 [Paraburkholderia sp. SIMBA_055]